MRDRLGISMGLAFGLIVAVTSGQGQTWPEPAVPPAVEGNLPGRVLKPGELPRGTILLAQESTKKGKARPKKGAPAKGEMPETKTDTAAVGAGASEIKFSRDIAPILVGNCVDCHNPERRRGKFDLTTFQKLMTGSAAGAVIVPGKPDESPLVLHIKGEAEPKMPPNNRDLAPEAISKIVAWVKAGARLDAGFEPTALLRTIAPTEEDRRRTELAKLAPAERDKKVEAVALERWSKAGSKSKPEMTSSASFLMFSNLPKDRASHTLKALDAQALVLRKLLSRTASSTVLDFPEKISVYVFNEPGTYVEFVRAVENREVDASAQAHGNFAVQTPYLAAVDPQAGREDDSQKKRPAKSKRGDDAGGAERTLTGLLVEQMGAAGTSQAGKAPRWLSLGLGAYLGMQVEPRSHYYRKLRDEALQEYKLGWQSKAQEALGDTTNIDKVRALGFSLVEWLATSRRAEFTVFARMMLDGPEKLDDVNKQVWNITRDEFLNEWGTWVAARYSGGR